MSHQIVAVLSSTVLTEGTFACHNVSFPADLSGVPHYVGHPATKSLIEALGAAQASERLFKGLEVGQSYLAVPLANNARAAGWTKDTAVSDISQLQAKLVTRLPETPNGEWVLVWKAALAMLLEYAVNMGANLPVEIYDHLKTVVAQDEAANS